MVLVRLHAGLITMNLITVNPVRPPISHIWAVGETVDRSTIRGGQHNVVNAARKIHIMKKLNMKCWNCHQLPHIQIGEKCRLRRHLLRPPLRVMKVLLETKVPNHRVVDGVGSGVGVLD